MCVYARVCTVVVDRENGLLINCHTAIARFGVILLGLNNITRIILHIILQLLHI
jgi:hypothetical protein